MVAAYKAVGTVATTTGTSIAVPVTAGAAGDYAVIDLFLGGQTTAPTTLQTPANWTLAYSDVNGAGGSRHVYYRAFTGTVSAGNATFTITAGGAYGKSVMHSAAGTGAPTVLSSKIDSAAAYWQSAAMTTAYPRAAAHFGFINAVRTQGSLSNQGTITSTNTSRGSNDSILGAYCLHTATSAITSSAGGSVRGAFSGGSQTSWTLTVLIPEAPPAAPTGLSVTGGARELDVTFDAVSGADSYVVEWRRTDLTAPSLSTQTSAPWSLDRLDDATGLDTTYTYTWNGSGKRVYAVDSGVRGTHTEFTGRLRTGTAIGGGSTADVNGHGTQVASAAVGTTYGTAKGATLVPVRMYAGSETSYLDTDWDAFDTLVAWIIADAAGEHHVVSFSGFYPRNGQTHYAQVTAAMQSLLAAGLTVVMAAGNENTSIDLGTGYAGCIIVGGTTNADARWNDGVGDGSVWATGITLWAPAKDVPLAFSSSDSATGTASGTSFAQPLTAGVAAKILHANPALSPPRVKEVLESQARSGILTGITAGPNLLLNSNAQTSDWSRHPVASTTVTLDGLDDAAAYEIRVITVDGGVESAASATDSATTNPPVVTGTMVVSAPTVTVAAPTVAWSGTATGLTFTGTLVADTPGVTVAVPTVAWSGTSTVPVFNGTLAADGPLVTVGAAEVVWAGSSIVSVYTGTMDATAPTVTVAVAEMVWTGSTGAPTFTGVLEVDAPTVAVGVAELSWSGASTVPVFTGALTSDAPSVTVAVPEVAWTGSSTVPVFTGTLETDTPVVTVGVPVSVWSGTASAPGSFAGNLEATAPGVTVSVATVEWAGSYIAPSGATLTADAPTVAVGAPTVSWTGTSQAPVFAATLVADAPTVLVGAPVTVWAGTSTPPIYTATLNAILPLITILAPVWEQVEGEIPPFPEVGTLVVDGPARTLGLTATARTLGVETVTRTLDWST